MKIPERPAQECQEETPCHDWVLFCFNRPYLDMICLNCHEGTRTDQRREFDPESDVLLPDEEIWFSECLGSCTRPIDLVHPCLGIAQGLHGGKAYKSFWATTPSGTVRDA